MESFCVILSALLMEVNIFVVWMIFFNSEKEVFVKKFQ